MRVLLLTLLSFTIISCKRKSNIPTYSSYKPIGNTYLSVSIDSNAAYREVVDNSFYLELSTAKNTFITKPYNYKISFPLLRNSLNKIAFYYKDFKFIATGNKAGKLKKFFYFPNSDSVSFYISKTPFKEEKSEKGSYYTSKQVFAKIQLNKSSVLFVTLSKDTVTYRR